MSVILFANEGHGVVKDVLISLVSVTLSLFVTTLCGEML